MQMEIQNAHTNTWLVRFPEAAKEIKPHFSVLNCTYISFKVEIQFSKMYWNRGLDPWKDIDFVEPVSEVLPTQMKSETQLKAVQI